MSSGSNTMNGVQKPNTKVDNNTELLKKIVDAFTSIDVQLIASPETNKIKLQPQNEIDRKN